MYFLHPVSKVVHQPILISQAFFRFYRAVSISRVFSLSVPHKSEDNVCKEAKFHTSHSQKYPVCELTVNRYSVTRGSFNKVSEETVNFFKTILEEHRVVTGEDELLGNNTDWLGMVRGFSSVLLKPKSTKEVSEILKYCNDNNLAVCPQGGNTGLVGGSVPVFDEVIISTALMNKVENVDEYSGVVTCQAGCVLEQLDQHVAKYGLMMPLDLGAKGSCHIGGNVSTNAGGLRLVRYGSLLGSVLGVEAVLASGEVIDCLSSMKKDNTGYSLKHLFIGSEGTLGLVSIHCPPRPLATSLAILGLDSFEDALKTFQEAKWKLGEILSSCEFFDDVSLDCVTSNLKISSPIAEHKFYMLIETSGSNATHDEEKLNTFLESTMNSGLINDGTVASEPSKMLDIWALRERIAEALLHDGYVYKYDVSIPLPVFYKVVEMMQERLKPANIIRCSGYGHIGDGNLHLNITSEKFDKSTLSLIEPYLYELIAKFKGSVSAEHGLGFKKKNFMSYSKTPSAIGLMKSLKKLMDPKGILNPYKVLPDK
ncbi:D-2-hydroxyglutarate dehydrogenase, mitochondrial, partial [Armadillidium nasatum]